MKLGNVKCIGELTSESELHSIDPQGLVGHQRYRVPYGIFVQTRQTKVQALASSLSGQMMRCDGNVP
jgi:hypothetical protein